ncbi:MAG: hypothetical protein JNK05_21140 [Myxococcales bacterium]|nr:hypothetical protein [Myxococcales bacterium]
MHGLTRIAALTCAGQLACAPLKPGVDRRDVSAPLDDVVDASPTDGGVGCPPPNERVAVRLPAVGTDAVIDSDTTWSCRFRYELAGPVFVTRNATLTVEAGVEVRAARDAMLLVTRGAQLVANGRRDAPIVFTSDRPVGTRAPRDWRGIVLLGSARTHDPINTAVDATTAPADARGHYGSGSAGPSTGNCGSLRFVRVEFAGGSTGSNGSPGAALSLAGCGTDTTVDYVQVHRGSDGVGLYGGEVALTHLLVTGAASDGIEWVRGYRGRMQFVIVQQRATGAGAGAAIKGNNAEGAESATPVSSPTIFNATLIGVDLVPMMPPTGEEVGYAMQFGSTGAIRNSILFGFKSYAFDVRHPSSTAAISTMTAGLSHSIVFDNGRGLMARPQFPGAGVELDDGDDDDGNFDEDTTLRQPGTRLRLVDPQLSNARADLVAPSFGTASNVIEQDTSLATAAGMQPTAFVGALAPNAVGDDDWTRGWTSYPNN